MKAKKIIGALAIACAVIVLFAAAVAVYKHYEKPVKNKLLGEEIGKAGLRYVYHDYIYNPKTGKKLVTDVDWLFVSSDDTLGILAKEGKRAYINLNTAELLTPLSFDKAWVFACNRGVMVRNDSVFIFRRDGSEVLPEPLPYEHEYELVFFRNRLVLHGAPEMVGVLDTAGHWVLTPEYKSVEINYAHQLYNTEKSNSCAVFDFDMNPILQGDYQSISVDWTEGLIVTEHNGIEHLFSYEGKLLYEVIYQSIRELQYETGKKDKEGNPVYEQTNCFVYEAYNGKSGLMNRQYKVLTPPLFYDIEPQTKHVFFASFGEYNSRFGTLIDELGRPIR